MAGCEDSANDGQTACSSLSTGIIHLVSLLVFLIAAVPAPALNRSAHGTAAAEQGRVKTNRSAAAPSSAERMLPIIIDYPEEGSVFPPEITAPTFLWRDGTKTATMWRVDVSFADGAPGLHTASKGRHLRVGTIDPACVSGTNRLPRLTARQAAERTWIPGAGMWNTIKGHSVAAAATVTITGFSDTSTPVSRGWVRILTSKDPVGAPIFYRDVPLMPTETEKGSIQPLAPYAVRLIEWRVRDIGEPRSRVLMKNVPMCANCHSFSADGKTLGMDLDGLQHNKGMYTLTPVQPDTSIRSENVIQWSSARGKLPGKVRVGFMSQVSPDGQYVVTTVNPPDMEGTRQSNAASTRDPMSNYYVANFKDYRFLQVFYPTRGILTWYGRSTGILQPLPGADDPGCVQMGAVWSPDGKYLVFARAPAKEPNPQGAPQAQFANDPNENQIQYDLYRIPFNAGKGGTPEPIVGASRNGMSNTFPKVSPDGRWIVFVQCRNGQLMRPDSRLFIVPASGGTARRLRCNTVLMNSWHSFSPNGRWLVFSSKSRSPYTQMYLTHIDSEGKDTPAILIENSTAANRAVNIPEFVNIAPGGMLKLDGPAIEYYRLVDDALYLKKQGRYAESVAAWRRVLEVVPDDALAHSNLGTLLLLTGHPREAAEHLNRAKDVRLSEAEAQLRRTLNFDVSYAPAHHDLGVVLSERGEAEGAIREWQEALKINPDYLEVHQDLGKAYYARGNFSGALAHWREVIRLHPDDAAALQQAAWILATSPEAAIRNGSEALILALRAVQVSGTDDPLLLDTLAAAYAEKGQFADAARTARSALALAERMDETARVAVLKIRIASYEAKVPYRETPTPSVHP